MVKKKHSNRTAHIKLVYTKENVLSTFANFSHTSCSQIRITLNWHQSPTATSTTGFGPSVFATNFWLIISFMYVCKYVYIWDLLSTDTFINEKYELNWIGVKCMKYGRIVLAANAGNLYIINVSIYVWWMFLNAGSNS